jgi:hypothetical protein
MLPNVAFTSVVLSCGVVVKPTMIGTPAGIVLVAVPTRIQSAPLVE